MAWQSFHSAAYGDKNAIKGASIKGSAVRRVWVFAYPYRWLMSGLFGLIVVGGLLGVVPPLLAKDLVDDITAGDSSRINRLAVLMVVIALGEALLNLVQRFWSSKIGEGLIYDLRVALFDHVQRMPISFFTRTQTGALISRLNNDVVGAQSAVTTTFTQTISNAITVSFTVIAMLTLEWRLTLVSLVVLPLFVIPAKRVGQQLQDISRRRMNLNSSMNTTMTERFNVAGALLVKLFGRHGDETRSFSDRAAGVRDSGIQFAVVGRVFFVALSLVGAIGTAIVYWWGAHMVIEQTISVGVLVALTAYLARIYQPLTALTNARVDLMTALVSFDRVFEVLDMPHVIEDIPGSIDLVDPEGRIELKDVTFTYGANDVSLASLEDPAIAMQNPGQATVLHAVNAVIEPGQMVALVGPSGAGKSTIASLIPRLYDATEGAVLIDGTDIRRVTQSSLRSAIGVVTQDPHMFHESIGSNLRYAKDDATEDELIAACTAAQIHHVIDALPDRYDTVVGERGYRLSGGEKQRLAIARMLLKDPSIVVLDEATSHLDAENEVLVQRALDTALQGRTSLVIAHRLSTIQAADQILVIDEGRIVQRGSHTELLDAGGLYADLFRTLQREDAPVV